MDFSIFADLEFLRTLLSDAGKASLTEKLFIVWLVWMLMGRKVSVHFKSLERGMADGFQKLAESIGEVKQALTQVENTHSHQLNELGKRVSTLEQVFPKNHNNLKPE